MSEFYCRKVKDNPTGEKLNMTCGIKSNYDMIVISHLSGQVAGNGGDPVVGVDDPPVGQVTRDVLVLH